MAYGFLRLKPNEFWNCTPKEISLMGKGFEKRYGDGKPKKMSSKEIASNITEAINLVRERGNSSGIRKSD